MLVADQCPWSTNVAPVRIDSSSPQASLQSIAAKLLLSLNQDRAGLLFVRLSGGVLFSLWRGDKVTELWSKGGLDCISLQGKKAILSDFYIK